MIHLRKATAILTSRSSFQRGFGDAAASLTRPVRPTSITPKERSALRAARKERASQQLKLEGSTASSSSSGGGSNSLAFSRWIWYASVGVPTVLITWALNDPDSPPAKLSKMIGLTGLITSFTDEIAKPANEKLIPDWSQMPNVPHDIPVPHTLVLDLENTLVSSTWDRKYGWRHAKRPGVDRFLRELANYYEIVLYSPSIDGVADPVVTSLDKDGTIMHRLYRDATYFYNGVHVKDLKRLNRNIKRMVVVDDDPLEVQFNPENHIRVKPYTDPNDRTDNTLERILPFLVEIARENYNDIPALLSQYKGLDADGIADEQERRIQAIKDFRMQKNQRGLGGLARSGSLPAPELPPSSDSSLFSSSVQLTAKQIAGAAPKIEHDVGLLGFMNRRAKEKEENQMRKMEKWQEIMMKKQKEKQEKGK